MYPPAPTGWSEKETRQASSCESFRFAGGVTETCHGRAAKGYVSLRMNIIAPVLTGVQTLQTPLVNDYHR